MSNLLLEKYLGNQIDIWGKDLKCSFCGDIPTGAWHGKENVFVCVSCATAVLPKLIADATLFPFRNNEQQISKAVKSNFWQAAAGLFRKRLKDKDKRSG